MHPVRTPERGDGRIGCIISLLLLITACGVCFKVAPVLYSNDSLFTAAETIASRAAIQPLKELEAQLKAKAMELEIPEALPKGAITWTLEGTKSEGTCTVELRYVRKVDLFGIYSLPITTDKTIRQPYVDVR